MALDVNEFELLMQFSLFNRDNSILYFQILSQESINLISLSEWFLKHNDKFIDNRSMEIFYKQLHSLITLCYYHLNSVYNIDLVSPLMENLTKLYSFMTVLIKQVSFGL